MAKNSTSLVDASSSSHAVCFMSVQLFDPYNMNRPHSVHPTWTVLATVNGIASLPTAVLNALIILAVFGDENLRSVSFNVLLAFLAVTDFLVGLLVEPMYCAFLACLLNHCYSPCQYTMCVLLFLVCTGMTMVTYTIASAERYLAIEHPNYYLDNITREKVLQVTVISWIAIIAYYLTASAFMTTNYVILFKVPMMLVISICALVILYCTFKVQLTAYRQSRAIALQQESVQQPDDQQQQQQQLDEYKRVFMMTVIVVVSILLYTPFVVVTVIEVVKGKDMTSDFKYVALPICVTLVHLQSLVNPIMMSLRLSYIRKAIKSKLAIFGFTGN